MLRSHFSFSLPRRSSNASPLPPETMCLDIFSLPGASEVVSHFAELSSSEIQSAAGLDEWLSPWFAGQRFCLSIVSLSADEVLRPGILRDLFWPPNTRIGFITSSGTCARRGPRSYSMTTNAPRPRRSAYRPWPPSRSRPPPSASAGAVAAMTACRLPASAISCAISQP